MLAGFEEESSNGIWIKFNYVHSFSPILRIDIADLFNLFILYGKSIYMYLEITMYKYEYQESVSFPR